MKKTPLQQVKEQFESKEKLIDAVKKLATDELWLDRVNDTKGLEKVSNAKLLRLHSVLETVKKDFGSRAKLIASIAELEKRTKDEAFQTRLEGHSLPRLLDEQRAAAKRAAKPTKPKAAKKKVARSKKAKAKAKAA